MAKRKQKHNSSRTNGHEGPKQEVNGTSPNQYPHRNSPIFKAWSGSRTSRASTEPLFPGSQRDFSLVNLFHAFQIVRLCLWDMFLLMWRLHPTRTTLLLLFNVVRGLFPAVRGYSRAAILDEVRSQPHDARTSTFSDIRWLIRFNIYSLQKAWPLAIWGNYSLRTASECLRRS
jgi:hypothetical protein